MTGPQGLSSHLSTPGTHTCTHSQTNSHSVRTFNFSISRILSEVFFGVGLSLESVVSPNLDRVIVASFVQKT